MIVYGIILSPIGWKLAFFVWGYALAWFVFNDFIKLEWSLIVRSEFYGYFERQLSQYP